jgi:hypothetical protein
MRHLLMDPAFPDIVGEWAREEAERQVPASSNDNEADAKKPWDWLLPLLARAEIDATRIS